MQDREGHFYWLVNLYSDQINLKMIILNVEQPKHWGKDCISITSEHSRYYFCHIKSTNREAQVSQKPCCSQIPSSFLSSSSHPSTLGTFPFLYKVNLKCQEGWIRLQQYILSVLTKIYINIFLWIKRSTNNTFVFLELKKIFWGTSILQSIPLQYINLPAKINDFGRITR